MKVLVGISGGVDSAVCATLLKERGYDVSAVMMKTYSGIQLGSSCYGSNKEEEIQDAAEICDKLNIDFHLIDLTKEFDEFVFQEFKEQYKNGSTPNPCVICNERVKFGAMIKKARESGLAFDKFATGHYANIVFENDRYCLKMGKNRKKDQSYFLYRLSQETLSNTLFPLGDMEKEEVREIARRCNFKVSEKKDSQDFYDGHYSEILNFPKKKGEIVLTSGEVLGFHDGIYNYTIGQRKGIGVAYSKPLYVVSLEADTNRVIVGTREETFSSSLIVNNINWGMIPFLSDKMEVLCKHRSVQKPVTCTIEPYGDKIKVNFKDMQTSITKGQSAVFYLDDKILCGGFIE